MEETTINTETQTIHRPGFLKTLCILTFIGAGLMILLTLMGTKEAFMSADERAMDITEQMAPLAESNPEMVDNMVEAVMENQKYALPTWIMGIIFNLLTLLAAIMMWNLKKAGFYLYCAAELLPLIISFGFFGGIASMKKSMGFFGESAAVIVIAGMIIFDILFIVLYALNLKHMKR